MIQQNLFCVIPNRLPRLPLLMAILINGLNWLIFVGLSPSVFPILLQQRVGEVFAIAGLIVIQLVSFTGILSAINTLISLVTSRVAGWLSDWSGNRWRLVVFSLGLGVVSMAFAAVGEGIVVILAITATAIVSSVLVTQTTTIIGDYTRKSTRQGRVIGLLNTAGDFGGAAGPLIAFALLPIIGLVGVYTVGTFLLAIALPPTIWMMLRER